MYSKLQDGSFIIAGFVAKDAEMKKSQNGKTYTNWSVKVGEKPSAVQGERGEAIWTNCRAWHDAARYAAHIKKGDSVMVVGRIETSEFISIMGKSPAAPAAAQAAPAADTYTDLSQFEEILSDGDVPF